MVQFASYVRRVLHKTRLIFSRINDSIVYKTGEVHLHLLGTNGYHARPKNEGFIVASFRCRQNLKYENCTSSFGSQKIAKSKNCIKKRAARAAPLFFLNKPIKPLICDVVVVVPFLYSLFLRWQFHPCQLFFFDTKFSCFTFPPTTPQNLYQLNLSFSKKKKKC